MLQSSTGSASLLNQPFNPCSDFLVLNKFPTLRLRNSPLHSRHKSSLILQHPLNGIPHKLLGVLAIRLRHLLQPCLNLGREMNVHPLIVPSPSQERQIRAANIPSLPDYASFGFWIGLKNSSGLEFTENERWCDFRVPEALAIKALKFPYGKIP
jgi:hypothetical protein